jgi:hypothetical protein
MVAAPAMMLATVADGIIGIVRPAASAGRPAGAAVLRLSRRQVKEQRDHADDNSDLHHRARHHLLHGGRRETGGIVRRKKALRLLRLVAKYGDPVH